MDIKHRIIEAFVPFDPERIIVFGSTAANTEDEFSDIDVIVVYRTQKRFLDRLKELYMSWSAPRAVDILAYTPEEYEEMLCTNAFVQDAVAHGETIYEKHVA